MAMNFYVVYDPEMASIGCEVSKKQAFARLREFGYKPGQGSVTRIRVNINKETVRRLLGDVGGYAIESEEIPWPTKR